MDRVIALVHAGCRVESCGGRFQLQSLNECVVHDVSTFPDSLWTSLKSKFPRLEIDVIGDRESLSGFHLHLRLSTSHRWRIMLTLAVAAGLSAVVVHFLI